MPILDFQKCPQESSNKGSFTLYILEVQDGFNFNHKSKDHMVVTCEGHCQDGVLGLKGP